MQLFTESIIKKHCTEESCWIVVDDKVYNVTDLLTEIPGSKEVLLTCAGTDATSTLKDSPLLPFKLDLLSKFLIGTYTSEATAKQLLNCSNQSKSSDKFIEQNMADVTEHASSSTALYEHQNSVPELLASHSEQETWENNSNESTSASVYAHDVEIVGSVSEIDDLEYTTQVTAASTKKQNDTSQTFPNVVVQQLPMTTVSAEDKVSSMESRNIQEKIVIQNTAVKVGEILGQLKKNNKKNSTFETVKKEELAAAKESECNEAYKKLEESKVDHEFIHVDVDKSEELNDSGVDPNDNIDSNDETCDVSSIQHQNIHVFVEKDLEKSDISHVPLQDEGKKIDIKDENTVPLQHECNKVKTSCQKQNENTKNVINISGTETKSDVEQLKRVDNYEYSSVKLFKSYAEDDSNSKKCLPSFTQYQIQNTTSATYANDVTTTSEVIPYMKHESMDATRSEEIDTKVTQTQPSTTILEINKKHCLNKSCESQESCDLATETRIYEEESSLKKQGQSSWETPANVFAVSSSSDCLTPKSATDDQDQVTSDDIRISDDISPQLVEDAVTVDALTDDSILEDAAQSSFSFDKNAFKKQQAVEEATNVETDEIESSDPDIQSENIQQNAETAPEQKAQSSDIKNEDGYKCECCDNTECQYLNKISSPNSDGTGNAESLSLHLQSLPPVEQLGYAENVPNASYLRSMKSAKPLQATNTSEIDTLIHYQPVTSSDLTCSNNELSNIEKYRKKWLQDSSIPILTGSALVLAFVLAYKYFKCGCEPN